MLKYKGYVGHVIYDDEGKIFHGELLGMRAVVTFQGTSVEEIESAFHDSVDDYLEWCEERNETPEKPFSGRFNLRIDPQLHAQLTLAAQAHGISLNNYIQTALNVYLAEKEQRLIA